ncbi:MAG TPA: N-6 DNA methylase, partial [Gemmataceae bacterium]
WYSTDRLRRLAERRRGTRHGDLWHALRLVMASLDAERGCPDLALPALGSFLWYPQAIAHLGGRELANADLLAAVRALCFVKDRGSGSVRPVDYKNLGTEELGSVYESLLELHPKVHAEAGTFELASAAGHERRTTGSYYTPHALVQALLDSALEPVLDEAVKAENPEAAILSLKVCDPAAGSGHFLVGAAHRIARRLAAARTGDLEPAPGEVRRALRDVTGRCLFGVDVNDMAVELCKIFLWMEGLEPGKPLSFLDAHVKQGNSLIGVTPALLAAGLPDTAFKALAGDDHKVTKSLKKRNRTEREMAARGQVQLALLRDWRARVAQLAAELATGTEQLDSMRDDSPGALRSKEQAFEALRGSGTYRRARLAADAWCAAFFQHKLKDRPHVTHDTVRRLAEDPATVDPEVLAEVERLAREFKFFHWHVEFPQVFHVPDGTAPGGDGPGWTGGFDVILGNPPWERIKLQEKEFFAAAGHTEIAQARNKAERERRIKALAEDDPLLLERFRERQRAAEAESAFLRRSGRYPLCGRGDVNTYAVFAEGMRALLAPRGQAGCILPTGIATDDTTKHFFADLMERQSLVSLFDFQSGPGLFAEIGHARYKFCLLTISGSQVRTPEAEFAFFLRDTAYLHDPERRFTLSFEDIALLSPNTRTCPIFRTRRDAEITKAIYRRVPVLIDERKGEAGNPWQVKFMAMFHMANDSGRFRDCEALTAEGFQLQGNRFVKGSEVWLPLYEAKMVHHF